MLIRRQSHTGRPHPARSVLLLILLILLGCGRAPAGGTQPPVELLGRFQDDYGDIFVISESLWTQLPHGRFHIVEWHPDRQYLLAWNDSSNSSDPGLWSRIDWLPLSDMAPYTWGFCLTAYRAPSRDSARATPAAERATPMTGCGGYPFSRMRRDSVE